MMDTEDAWFYYHDEARELIDLAVVKKTRWAKLTYSEHTLQACLGMAINCPVTKGKHSLRRRFREILC